LTEQSEVYVSDFVPHREREKAAADRRAQEGEKLRRQYAEAKRGPFDTQIEVHYDRLLRGRDSKVVAVRPFWHHTSDSGDRGTSTTSWYAMSNGNIIDSNGRHWKLRRLVDMASQ
jgi:hypothetical protein